MGHLYKGGMWFKKKSVLLAEGNYNTEKSVDGTDLRIVGVFRGWSVSHTLPSAADAGDYFYLPALGSYVSGQLNYVGNAGYYWSSSTTSWNNVYAYRMFFHSGSVHVGNDGRINGFRVGGFE